MLNRYMCIRAFPRVRPSASFCGRLTRDRVVTSPRSGKLVRRCWRIAIRSGVTLSVGDWVSNDMKKGAPRLPKRAAKRRTASPSHSYDNARFTENNNSTNTNTNTNTQHHPTTSNNLQQPPTPTTTTTTTNNNNNNRHRHWQEADAEH